MMLEVFTDSSKPFYKFGNLIFLDKIATSSGGVFLIEYVVFRKVKTAAVRIAAV